jgi:NAD(P)H-hydrate epimerase
MCDREHQVLPKLQEKTLAVTVSIRSLSRQEVRRLDEQATQELGLPSLILMENAGRGAAGWLAELAAVFPPDASFRPFSPPDPIPGTASDTGRNLPKIVILCGSGNNGGDGAVLARHLNAWGFFVQVVWFTRSSELCGDAAVQWEILKKSAVAQSAWFDTTPPGSDQVDSVQLATMLDQADWLVDGLLGTGLSRPVTGSLYAVIEAMNHSGKPILALDLPSGLDTDTGKPLGTAVRARATATFVAAKLGFSAPGAASFTGQIAIIDIGLPRCLLEPYLESPDTRGTVTQNRGQGYE